MLRDIIETIEWKCVNDSNIVVLVDQSYIEFFKVNSYNRKSNIASFVNTDANMLSHQVFELSNDSIHTIIQYISDNKTSKIVVFTCNILYKFTKTIKNILLSSSSNSVDYDQLECTIFTSMSSEIVASIQHTKNLQRLDSNPYNEIQELLSPTIVSIAYLPLHTTKLLTNELKALSTSVLTSLPTILQPPPISSEQSELELGIMSSFIVRYIQPITSNMIHYENNIEQNKNLSIIDTNHNDTINNSNNNMYITIDDNLNVFELNASDLPTTIKCRLKLLAHELAGSLIFQYGLDVSENIHAIGKTSSVLGHNILSMLDTARDYKTKFENESKPLCSMIDVLQGRGVGGVLSQAALIIVDRIDDLLTPISCTSSVHISATNNSTTSINTSTTTNYRSSSTNSNSATTTSLDTNSISDYVASILKRCPLAHRMQNTLKYGQYSVPSTSIATTANAMATASSSEIISAVVGISTITTSQPQHHNSRAENSHHSIECDTLVNFTILKTLPDDCDIFHSHIDRSVETKPDNSNNSYSNDNNNDNNNQHLEVDEIDEVKATLSSIFIHPMSALTGLSFPTKPSILYQTSQDSFHTTSNTTTNTTTSSSQNSSSNAVASVIVMSNIQRCIMTGDEETGRLALCNSLKSKIIYEQGTLPPIKKRGLGAEILAYTQALSQSPGYNDQGIKMFPRINYKILGYYPLTCMRSIELLAICYAVIETMQRCSAKQFKNICDWQGSFEVRGAREMDLDNLAYKYQDFDICIAHITAYFLGGISEKAEKKKKFIAGNKSKSENENGRT